MISPLLLHTIVTILVIFTIIFVMLSLNYNLDDFFLYLRTTNLQLKNENLNDLINGNGIQNLPSVNINTTDLTVNRLQSCRDGPVLMGQTASEFSCRQMCGASASLVHVDDSREIFSNGERLQNGMWCMLNPPNCNLNTTFAVSTVNSVACRSRHPRIFGGELGNNIVACNNQQYFNSDNIIWDNLSNMRVSQYTQIQDADELLPNGTFRFNCQFGDDDFGNRFMPHTIDRLHPMRDYCSSTIFKGSRQIQQMLNGACDCGAYQDTRVRNKRVDDEFSTCTSCYHTRNTNTEISRVSYECFTLNSPYHMVGDRVPCVASQFIRNGNFCGSIDVPTAQTRMGRAFEFHPVLDSGILLDSAPFEF
jgi:hypothetical protein